MIITSGSGSLIDICLQFPFFKECIGMIMVDRECNAQFVAEKHRINCKKILHKDSDRLNQAILKNALEEEVDYIISYSFLRIFWGEILECYENRIFNSHYSILPAFRGYYDTRDNNRKFKARQVFERTLDFSSRVTGNTIHVVNENVDDGCPVINSIMNIPYDEENKEIRHQLFILECQCLLQVVHWLKEDRIYVDNENHIRIRNAKFDKLGFSPNLEVPEIINFKLKNPFIN